MVAGVAQLLQQLFTGGSVVHLQPARHGGNAGKNHPERVAQGGVEVLQHRLGSVDVTWKHLDGAECKVDHRRNQNMVVIVQRRDGEGGLHHWKAGNAGNGGVLAAQRQ